MLKIRVFRILVCAAFFLIIAGSQSGFAEPVLPKAEYYFAIIDLTKPSEISALMFLAFSSEELSDTPSKFAFLDIAKEDVTEVKVLDYVFFDQRYLRSIDKHFQDQETAKYYLMKQRQDLEYFSIFLFQQPFWSIHLATKLPTSFLEWQLSLREKFAGRDPWPRVFSASGENLSADVSLSDCQWDRDSCEISYFIPKTSDKLTTRGLMISYTHTMAEKDDLSVEIGNILNPYIVDDKSGQKLNIPIVRYFIQSPLDNPFTIGSHEATFMDPDTLTHRIASKETGVFFFDSFVHLDDTLIQKFEMYVIPVEESVPITLVSKWFLRPNAFSWREPAKKPDRMDTAQKGARIFILGLFLWVILFNLFHWGALKKLRFFKKILISLLSYVVYLALSTIFAFLVGFSFALGIAGMEVCVKYNSRDYPTWKLFGYGVLTSVVVAIAVNFMV